MNEDPEVLDYVMRRMREANHASRAANSVELLPEGQKSSVPLVDELTTRIYGDYEGTVLGEYVPPTS